MVLKLREVRTAGLGHTVQCQRKKTWKSLYLVSTPQVQQRKYKQRFKILCYKITDERFVIIWYAE
jgi:hypothetical protein